MANCPVCLDVAEVPLAPPQFKFVRCPGCGEFGIDSKAEALLNELPGKRGLISHRIRLANESNTKIDLDSAMLRGLLRSYQVPSVARQKDAFIRWFGSSLLELGQPHLRTSIKNEARRITAIIGAAPPISSGGLLYVINALVSQQALSATMSQYSDWVGMTAAGWELYERLTTAKPPAVPYSPRELPTAIDFLNSVWEKKFGEPLLELRSAEKLVSIGFDCANFEDLKARISDLSEMLRWIEVADEQLPSEVTIGRAEKLNRLEAYLAALASDADAANLKGTTGTLKSVVKIRNKLTHKGSPELIEALAQLGIEFPIEQYDVAWNIIRARASEALTAIRMLIQSCQTE